MLIERKIKSNRLENGHEETMQFNLVTSSVNDKFVVYQLVVETTYRDSQQIKGSFSVRRSDLKVLDLGVYVEIVLDKELLKELKAEAEKMTKLLNEEFS